MESVEEVLVRYGEEQDYADVEEIMQQVQKLHTRWRPDIYKDVVPILTFDTYMSFFERKSGHRSLGGWKGCRTTDLCDEKYFRWPHAGEKSIVRGFYGGG